MRHTILFFTILFLIACRGDKNNIGKGDSHLNYPDMEHIIKNELDPYLQQPISMLKTNFQNNKKDTSYVKANDVKWNHIKDIMMACNIYKSQFDYKYKVDAITDSTSPNTVFVYSPLSRKLDVKTISVHRDDVQNKMTSIYMEKSDKGFFTSSTIKLLYVVGKLIQIQEKSKKPFQKEKNEIVQYDFIN